MNCVILINGQDVTTACRLHETRISYDSTRRVTTASITAMGSAIQRSARYDYAHYDKDHYALSMRELYEVVILDGRDGVTKLFDGQIYSLEMAQSDSANFDIFYRAELNDWAAWLDRSVCWDSSYALALPSSDAQIITALLTKFCPRIHLVEVATIVPVIQAFDWRSKTCRQVLDDIAALSMGEWRVDFDGGLHYGLQSAAPNAPFILSTSPDYVTSFPVNVNGYRHDFTNPVNRAYVRGAADPSSGAWIEASYSDPLSIQQYGEYASAVVDDQITTGWDAQLKAKSTVLRYSLPIEQGNFTIWRDGLACGQQVHIIEENLGMDGWYTIRSLALAWESDSLVRYEAQFGAAQPDLETLLRLMEQRARWASTTTPVGTPKPGSVTDASIASGGLHAGSIATVNAGTILGQIVASQVGSVNAGAIVGAINSGQIGSVAATTIQGAIVAGQIGSVNATTIQGVVVSSQLADKIISDLSKFADALVPIRMIPSSAALPSLPNKDYPPNSFFYYQPDGHFYRINAAGTSWAQNDNPQGALPSFYNIGAMSANSIVGLIVAAQIQTITAGQITGQISAGQIGSVNASAISGQIAASQIGSVNATAIQGSITSGQISSVNATAITGTLSAAQIGTVNASAISGTLSYNQIGSINAATITVGTLVDNQIGTVSGGKIIAGTVTSDKLYSNNIDVGGGGGKPGVLNVRDGSNGLVAQLGTLNTGQYGGWFLLFGAGGSSYTNAAVKTDASGNLYITNANLSVSISGYSATLSPSTIDPEYSSLAMNIVGGSDKAAFVSRGMILYSGGAKVGAFVRSPFGGYGELSLMTTGGGNYILLTAQTGIARADGGFQVGGSTGNTANVDCAGVHLKFVGGIYCGAW